MNVYYGDLKDSKNLESSSFLQLNSCGNSTTLGSEYLVVRSGRSDYHILYVIEGEVEIYSDRETVRLGAGDFVLFPPKTSQKYKRLPFSKDSWIHFNGFQLPEILSDAGMKAGVYRAEPSGEIKRLFAELLTEYSIKRNGSVNTEKGLLLTLLYTLGKSAAGNSLSDMESPVRKAVLYINENYGKDFTNVLLAKLCNLSTGRFEHLFKSETGVSPSAYRQRLRIENAKQLLTSSDLSVSEIAALCGFNDQLYFSRIFKSKTKVSPSEYRRLHLR